MSITFTLTQLSRNQWKKVGVVALYVLASVLCSEVLAIVTHDAKYFGTTAPAFNFVLVLLKQIFNEEQDRAISELPAEIQPKVSAVAAEASSLAMPS